MAGDRNDNPAQPNPESGAAAGLQDQLAAAIADRDANQDRLIRAQAEFDNIRKRMQRDADEARKYFAAALVRDILSPLDNLHRAVAAAEAATAGKAGAADPKKAIDDLLQGVRMVTKQFDDALAKHNAVPIDAVGQPFDPNLHEALTQVPSDQPAGTVVQEAERGYKMHDRVIRPSRVIVAAPK